MPLFGSKADDRRRREEALKNERPLDPKLEERLGELAAAGNRGELDRAASEVEAVVNEAARMDLRNIKLIEQGRCPTCQSETVHFLFTVVCPTCGWYHRMLPDCGRSVVHLDTGDEIPCDHVFQGRDGELLCILDGVVIAQVMRRYVRQISHHWQDVELHRARERMEKSRTGVCSWCEKDLAEADEDGPFIDYVAFGAMQEKFVFCSEKCMESFRKQYPSRVHRNCYETDCANCDMCIKRYDVHGFRRRILA